MTDPHPLTPLLAPRSVAIFGASNDPGRISGRPLRYFLEAGYSVRSIRSTQTARRFRACQPYPDLAAVPGPIEFALIAVPAALTAAALDALILTPAGSAG